MADGDGRNSTSSAVFAAGLDPSDPDAIAARPPPKVIDAKTYFQTGQHEDMWSEYDDRGVPMKNIKKKKPTKKEKDQLETDYLEASKSYQKYLKDVENWEQAKLDAEKDLKTSDRLRWCYRQVGEKQAPIDADDMETIIKLMGWKALSAKEFKIVTTKGLTPIAVDGKIELEALRVYVRDVMPIQLLEERIQSDQLDNIDLEDLYSPRTWRGKLDADPVASAKNKAKGSAKSSAKGAVKKPGATSPRAAAGKASASPRPNDSARKPKPKAKKKA